MGFQKIGSIWFCALFVLHPLDAVAELQTFLRLEHDGGTRYYDLYVPEIVGDSPLPLVLDLHGYGRTSSQQREVSRLDSLAEREGFFAAFPRGLGLEWNFQFGAPGNDDVGALRAIVADISNHYSIDPGRVYVTGHSMGGSMAYRLACEAADQFAAATTFAGSVVNGSQAACSPDRPISVLLFRGENDEVVPFEGGQNGLGFNIISASDTFQFWREVNQCSGPVERETLGNTSKCDTDKNCSGDTQVSLCSVQGGVPRGHGLYQNTDNLDLTQRSWNFLKQFSLTPAFVINAGQAGAWFNPETPGQGQLIDVEPESEFMFVSWFTFTDAASANPNEQHWFTAQGNYSGNTADLIVYETLGGQFDDPQEVSTDPVGVASLSFSECGLGQMSYSIETWDVEGSFPMQRVIPGTENVCQQQAGLNNDPLDENDGWDGAWFDEETPGQGFLIDAHPNSEGDDFIFVAWFTYGDDTASGQRWLTAQGPLKGTTADLVVYETTGGSFNAPITDETNPVGTMTIDFTDCSHALLTYSLTDEGLEESIQIQRTIPGTEALCQELSS
jgi:polyhydroxybutyrate depolymerase